MSSNASVAMVAHVGATGRTLAWCWKVTRTDTLVFGFTSHDRDLVVDGVTYKAATGITPSALSSRAGLSVDNFEAAGAFDSEAITEEDLRAGKWDHAEVRLFLVNWADISMGVIKESRGWIGEVVIGNGYRAELRALTSALNKVIGRLVSPACSALLGDNRCKKNLTEYTAAGEVVDSFVDLSGVVVRIDVDTLGPPPADYFAGGILTWTTGENTGFSIEIKGNTAEGEVEFQLPMPFTPAEGDEFTIVAGCDHTDETCKRKFGNIVNFRGDPFVPGIDKTMRYGGQ